MTNTLKNLVVVNSRFARSVSLVRDVVRPEALDGYILTPTGRGVLHRLGDALRGQSQSRAWSLTGPYGSGKSAFALFCAGLLGGDQGPRPQARRILQKEDPSLDDRIFGSGSKLYGKNNRLCCVLVSGSRQPLAKVLASSLAFTLRRLIAKGRPPRIVEHLENLASQKAPSSSEIVARFEEANEFIASYGLSGILLIVDELGKFLEFGASNPDQGDVFVLQELAEAATRSKRPFLVLTILHQAIDGYCAHMSPSRRTEWSKVHGRFDDVAFEEGTEEILRLVSHAIHHQGGESDLRLLRKHAKSLAQDALSLGIRLGSLAEKDLGNYLAASYPLHPLTALILGPLFRQLAQNERSLFAFLASVEPCGFQEFLRHALGPETFRLDLLFDYVLASLGSAIFAHHRGREWAEVQAALDRLQDASELEIRLAKTIGLLQSLGKSVSVSTSRKTLHLAMKGMATDKEIDTAIDSLSRRSLVIFRRHLDGYCLWEGSDLDIDARLTEACKGIERDQKLAAFLTSQVPREHMIARRHYFQKGTLRYFDTCYADSTNLQDELSRAFGEADGRVVLCLPRNTEERDEMRKSILKTDADLPVVVALPEEIFDLQELCHELAGLRWLAEHTPELESDRTARKEVHARLTLAETNLRNHLDWVFSPGNADRSSWFFQGEEIALESRRDLNDLLSRACDEVYSSTPKWRNELINRRSLSSSAAAARRNLIEAMFEHAHEEALGFSGNPPEKSMYQTILKAGHFHRKQGGILGIHGPDRKVEDSAVWDVWQTIDAFLGETENSKMSVEQFFDVLRDAPFGLKDGVLPVLLAATLIHYQSQVALYEEGSFVPRPNVAVFERIFKHPDKFDLQRFRITGPRAEVFQHYADMLTRAGAAQRDGSDLLTIVRPLVRLVKDLPDYSGKTKLISQTAQNILRVIRDARQPDRLLFVDLPSSCGFLAFEPKGKVNRDGVEAYFETLRLGLAELQRAYPKLMADIEELIVRAFGHSKTLAAFRKEIEHEARLVLNVAVDAKLKTFLMRVIDAETEHQTWLESISTLLAGKPPTVWDDQDRARFEVQLGAIARTFEHFKVLAYEMQRSGFALLDGDHRLLRISITVPNSVDLERVVQVPPDLRETAEVATRGLRRVLEEQHLLDKTEVSVALLAQLARQLLSESEPKESTNE